MGNHYMTKKKNMPMWQRPSLDDQGTNLKNPLHLLQMSDLRPQHMPRIIKIKFWRVMAVGITYPYPTWTERFVGDV